MMPSDWICDKCGGVIRDPRDGCVEWLVRNEGGQRAGRGLRLVHSDRRDPENGLPRDCRYNSRLEDERDGSGINDSALENFLGPVGLLEFMGMLDCGVPPTEEITEMIRRLYIPGYEQTRKVAVGIGPS